jgi:hypothetical protein
MAAKRRKKKQGPRASGLGPPETNPRPPDASGAPKPVARKNPSAEPTFWFGFEVSWAKLAIARVVVFGLLAIDALMQIRHAPRYGAGGFNVGQLAIFDSLGPSRESYEVCELIAAYLFVTIACGAGTRIALPLAAAIYSWLYFGSQLDSYQHHYLVALLLWLACFVPWQRPAGAEAATPVRSWALRLMLVQIAIMYLWAAISKMNPAWWDGSTLDRQITGTMRSMIDHTVGFAWASRLVIPVELTLACTIWNRRTWIIAAPLGLAFHLGIVASGLEIGLFAWLMIGLYTLVIPDAIWIAIARPVLTRLPTSVPGRWVAWTAAFAAALVFASLCRFEHALALAIAIAFRLLLRTFTAVVRGGANIAWLAAAHALAIATWLVVDRASSVAGDYYLYWGGSARRLGDTDSALRAYERAVEIDPDSVTGHYHLGKLLLARDLADDGLAELHEAQQLDQHHARAFVAEAEWLASHGRRAEAAAKAREGARAEPGDEAAKQLVRTLR